MSVTAVGKDIDEALSTLFKSLFRTKNANFLPKNEPVSLNYLVEANGGYTVVEVSSLNSGIVRRFRINYALLPESCEKATTLSLVRPSSL